MSVRTIATPYGPLRTASNKRYAVVGAGFMGSGPVVLMRSGSLAKATKWIDRNQRVAVVVDTMAGVS